MGIVVVVIIILAIIIIRIALRNHCVEENFPYEENKLLTKYELSFYHILYPVAVKHQLNILAKVRMADIVKVKSGTNNYMSYFNRISSKHVDFILVNPVDMEVRLLIELDDSTHNRKDRSDRDEFVDNVYSAAGIPIVHITSIKDDISTIISNALMY